MDGGGRATQEAKAEGEGIYKTMSYQLYHPQPNPFQRGEELTGQQSNET